MKPSEEIFQQKTDFKEILNKLLRNKHYFVITVVIAMAIAYVVNKFSQRIYYNKAVLMVKVDNKTSFLSGDDVMSGFGLFGGIQNVENELSVLQSFSVIYQAVQELNLEVTYMTEKNLFPVDFLPYKSYYELYKSAPIKVIIDQTHPQAVNLRFYIDIINDSTFKLTAQGYNVPLYDYIENQVKFRADTIMLNGVYKFGEEIESFDYKFSVHLSENYFPGLPEDTKMFFYFNNLYGLTGYFKGRLGVNTTTSTSSVVNVSLTGPHPKKITDFLNTLTRVYLNTNLEKKNKIAFSTVKFIDSRISDIADSLFYAENKLQNFRSSNQVMNISFQGQKLYEKMNELEAERALLIVQQKYFDYIREYFEKNNDVSDLSAPSSMEVQDPVLTQLIGELLALNSERMNYLQQSNSKNLFLRDLEIQISNLKSTILENIDYSYNRTEIALKDIDSRMAKLNSQIRGLPRTERELIGMERQFKLNDAIYTFLLQKRSEAQIAQASNTADYEIIDNAYPFRASLIAPKPIMSYIIAIFLGVLIPFIFIIARDFMNNKVKEIKDIENLTSFPIVGNILTNKFDSNAIIKDYPKSPLADSFRAIRTNLRFFSKGTDKMVILITSSISGEGKSFCSVNLASVYALLGKKTVLLGFDLRRPALYKDLSLKNEKGISSYLINNAEMDAIIQKTGINNLDLISAGPIPPNPMELIASQRTNDFFEELKKRYDYIVIDSSPIGAVTDSFLLFNFADINIFTVRHNYSIKEVVKSNLKNIVSKEINNVALIVNDVKIKKNSYGYAYQSNYYSQTSKPRWKRLFSRKKKKKKK